LIFPQFTL